MAAKSQSLNPLKRIYELFCSSKVKGKHPPPLPVQLQALDVNLPVQALAVKLPAPDSAEVHTPSPKKRKALNLPAPDTEEVHTPSPKQRKVEILEESGLTREFQQYIDDLLEDEITREYIINRLTA